MTFSESVKTELAENLPKKSCCRKSMLCGVLINATPPQNEGGEVSGKMSAVFSSERAAEITEELLKSQFSAAGIAGEFFRAGKRYFATQFEHPLLVKILRELERQSTDNIAETVGFRCKDCPAAYLRGIFLAAATVSPPRGGYHLEFLITNTDEDCKKAEKLASFLSSLGFEPKIRRAGDKKIGLYYKNNTVISDILYFAGAPKSSFYVANTYIENDIRNNENRATNCVAQNISKSIGAAQKHIAAIKRLIAENRLRHLAPELITTALLRIENDSATLAELAALHDPPISKSGLNHRLAKIMEAEREK